MKFSLLLLFALGAQASWFGSDTPAYQSWDTKKLTAWLKEHNILVPSGTPPQKVLQALVKSHWAATQQYGADQYDTASQYGSDQYTNAQHTLQNVKESAFDTWDESTLRQFLLDQGIVAPKGPREQLVQLAKGKYRDYQSALSSLSYTVSTGVYGSPAYQATQSLSSVIAQATADVSRKLDDSKDYVYSTWDDNRLRKFLEEKGVLKTKQQASRDEMLNLMRGYYSKVTDPVYETWSDSYLHEWLVSHGLAQSSTSPRASLLERMKWYYYDVTQKVWNTWSDSDLKEWLVEHSVVKSSAQINREKLEKLVSDNYLNAEDTIWSSWRDSDIRKWLVERGYVESEKANKLSRPELVKLINNKYNDVSARTAPYLVWPDARLRAYLREHGLSEDALPTSRPGLLQEARIRYTLTTTRVEALYQRVIDLLGSGIHIAEDKLWAVLEILTGTKEHAVNRAAEGKASVVSATAEASGKAKSEL